MTSQKNSSLKYQWDLEALLQKQTIEELYAEWIKLLKQQLKAYPDIFTNYSNFKKWLTLGERVNLISNRLYNYISNNANINVVDPKWIAYTQKINQDANKFSVHFSDYNNRVLANEKAIKTYLKNKEISEYQRAFDLMFKFKPHTLPIAEEKILAELSKADGGVDEMYETLLASDIKFVAATDTKNKSHPIQTMSDAFIYMKSSDRNLRKSAWINFNMAFYNFRNTLTHAIYYNFLDLNTSAKIRKHKDYVEQCCFDDEIDRQLITFIYQQVKNFKLSHTEYSKHRNGLLKGLLTLKTLEPWDLNVDLCHEEVKFDIEQAKNIVLQALKPLGSEYLSIVQKAFEERWISWLPQANKQPGAYSIGGTKGLDKFYILMNYDKTLNSVSTLIHELGHSLNSYFYSKSQKVYASTSIFTAEIASITNEMLLNYYLLEKYADNKKMQAMVLDELLSGFFATTTRQIIFSNFEYKIAEMIDQNKPVTYEVIEKLYAELLNQYMYIEDPEKYKKEPYKYNLATPLRISHFFVGNFYVYKYAIGQVVGCLVAHRIKHQTPQMIEKYMQFLSSGTSKSPLETIKILGIDLHDPKVWKEAITIINEFIAKFKTIRKI